MTDTAWPNASRFPPLAPEIARAWQGFPNLDRPIFPKFVGLVLEVIRIRSRGKFPITPLAIGLGVVVPPESTFMMFCGAAFFAFANRQWGPKEGSFANRLWVQTQEPICAGIIAGAALIGIGDVLVRVFLLK